MEIPPEGVSAKKLCDDLVLTSGVEKDVALQRIADSIRAGEAHQRGEKLFPGKRKPGRPPAENPRVSLTVRLPKDIADWLKTQNNYTRIIEDLLRVELSRKRHLDSMIGKTQRR